MNQSQKISEVESVLGPLTLAGAKLEGDFLDVMLDSALEEVKSTEQSQKPEAKTIQ